MLICQQFNPWYMRKFLLLIFCTPFFKSLNAQSPKVANDAYIITRMAEKFHVQPRLFNDDFSRDAFYLFLKELDDERLYFTQEDINKLQPYILQIDDQVKQKKTDFLQLATSLYEQ